MMAKRVKNLKKGGEDVDREILCSMNVVSILLMPGMLRTVRARSQPLLNDRKITDAVESQLVASLVMSKSEGGCGQLQKRLCCIRLSVRRVPYSIHEV